MINHWDAWCNLIGSLFGVWGGFFLAYDIIGGKKGPLAGMTRTVTYIFLFGICYTIGLGLRFGLIASLGLGISVGLEFYLESRWSGSKRKTLPKFFGLHLGSGRSFFLSVALAAITDWKVGLILFPSNIIVLMILDLAGIAPSFERDVSPVLIFRGKQVLGCLLRGVAAGLCCWLAEGLAGNNDFYSTVPPWRFGLTVGGTAIIIGVFTPWIEWWVERMSQRWLAAIGILLVITGFILQALPNWIILLG